MDELEEMPITTRPMFGCTAIYLEDKIVLILRDRPEYVSDNGVWVATLPEHHASLKKEFPSMRSIALFGEKPTAWRNLPASSDDFEESVLKVCALVRERDPRIGKVPKPKRKKLAARSKTNPKTKKEN